MDGIEIEMALVRELADNTEKVAHELFHLNEFQARLFNELFHINQKLNHLLAKGEKEMSALQDLQAAVAAEITVEQSAITLINGIPALIAAAGTDPAALQALQTEIASSSASLAAAVAANTPAAPTPSAPTAAPIATPAPTPAPDPAATTPAPATT